MTAPAHRLGRYCRKCDYDLMACTTPVCPECGRAFSPDNPKTFRRFPARSWRFRLRRWGFVIVPLILLAALWPKGWIATEVTWVDSAGGGKVTSQSLLIAHPWWTGGWYSPIGRTTQTGAEPFALPAGGGAQMNVSLRRCDSAKLWRSHSVGTGTLSLPVSFTTPLTSAEEWTRVVRFYTRATADVTAATSAPMGGLSISYRDVAAAINSAESKK